MKSINPKIYDKNYYTNICLGSAEFKQTQGKKLHPRLINLLSKIEIPKGTRVLDIGCGRGDISLYIAKQATEVVGIDYSKDAISLANSMKKKVPRALGKKVQFIKTDAKKLPFGNDSFDIVVCIDVFEHLFKEELEQTLKEISRVLKPNGVLFVHTGTNKILYNFTYKYYIYPVNKVLTFLDQKIKKTQYKSFSSDPRTREEKIQHVNEPTYFYLKNLFSRHAFKGKIKIEIGYLKENKSFRTILYNGLTALYPLSKLFPLHLLFGWAFICTMINKKN